MSSQSILTTSVESAQLPVTYENAKTALAECSQLDECKDWADKAQAMASYARQAKDGSLQKMAERIRARAIRRCGELLKQIESAQGSRTDVKLHTGSGTKLSRQQAAKDAGLSKRQKDTALRVASIPAEEFESAVESDDLPTLTQLADQGTAKKPKPIVDLEGIDPEDYALATQAQGTIRRFAEFCGNNPPERIARAFKPHELASLRKYVGIVDVWMDKFIVNLRD